MPKLGPKGFVGRPNNVPIPDNIRNNQNIPSTTSFGHFKTRFDAKYAQGFECTHI